MHRIRIPAATAVIGTAAVIGTTVPAQARPPYEPNSPANTVVEVPVEVPVDDSGAEAVQMALAAALGAVVTGFGYRRRRRSTPPGQAGSPTDTPSTEDPPSPSMELMLM
jgi:hypothetical protein